MRAGRAPARCWPRDLRPSGGRPMTRSPECRPHSQRRELKGNPMSPTIIIGFDGSDGGRDALALGAILRDATGARLLAVSAYEGSYAASPPAEGSRYAMRRHAEVAAEEARGWLEGAPRSESC